MKKLKKMGMAMRAWLKRPGSTGKKRATPMPYRDHLIEQIKMADDFYKFVKEAHSRGFPAQLVVSVDGQHCSTGVNLAAGTDRELFEYLCSWAAGQKLKHIERLAEWDKSPGFLSRRENSRIRGDKSPD